MVADERIVVEGRCKMLSATLGLTKLQEGLDKYVIARLSGTPS